MEQGIEDVVVDQPGRSNVLGIVGFVLSFCLSPIGFIISLMALFTPPRGFAIAGTIVGLIGTVIWAVVGYGFVVAGGTMIAAGSIMLEYERISQAVEQHKQDTGSLPTSLDQTGLPQDQKIDYWGNAYVYEVADDGQSWSITSAYKDGTFGTGDDVTLSSDMTQDERQEVLARAIQGEFGVESEANGQSDQSDGAGGN